MSEAVASESLDAAVELTREILRNDGYDVRLDGCDAAELRLTIIAGPDACADCLVPKELMAQIISAQLPTDLRGKQVVLTYPTEVTSG
jgi:hypothetical protein